MVIGVLRGARACRRSSNASVTTICRRSGVTGRWTPAVAARASDQAPATQMTEPVVTRPAPVTTAATPEASASMAATSTPVRSVGAQAPGRRGVALDHTVGRADAVPGVERRRQEVVGAQHRGQAGRLGRGQQAGGHAHRVLQSHRSFEGGQVLGRGQAEQVPDLIQVDGPARPLGEALEGLQAPGPEGDVDRVGELGPDPARRLRRGARPQRVPFEEEDVGHPRFGQVEGDGRAHDPATDDHHLSRGRQGRPAHVKVTPWASGSSSE